jgi:hypothetical protein
MPSTKRPKPLYQRGDFRLYPARPGRPNLEIVWYDPTRKRERSSSAGTSCDRAARLELDRRYLAATGTRVCSECGRPMEADASPLLLNAVTDYLLRSEGKAGYKATKGRMAHVVDFTASHCPAVTCAAIDKPWVDRLRTWLAAKPVRGGERRIGGVEGVVRQLAACINATPGQRAQFAAEQTKAVARSPVYRADVAMLAAMFRFCLYPKARSDRERAQIIGQRANLLAYLRAAVATWARPEEIFDLGQGQWTPAARVLNLNPPGRRQTRKYRTVIPVPRQFAPHLDRMEGKWMKVGTVRASWAAMREAVGLPGGGEAGEKLIRRSMATIVRREIGEANWRQGELMLGHRKHAISDIYAVPDPANLGLALAATEAVIDQIEALCPGAYRAVTALRVVSCG